MADVVMVMKLRRGDAAQIAVGVVPTRGWARRRLQESAIDAGDSTVRAREKRNSHQQLFGRNSPTPERAHRGIDGEVRRWIIWRGVEWRVQVRDRAAGVIVVGHDVDEVEQRSDSVDLDVRNFFWSRRSGDRQLVGSFI